MIALVAVAVTAARVDVVAASPTGLEAQRVTVVMAARRCTVTTTAPLAAGRVVFTVRNRSGRPRRFAIAGRRTGWVRPSRFATLGLALRAGTHVYACAARGRPPSVRRGRVRVWAPAQPRVLYASDWSGTYQVYAADSAGRGGAGQVTFGAAPACMPGHPCGFVDPVASPDGRRVLFSDYVVQRSSARTLFVAAADGVGRRALATVDDFHLSAAWSADSRRIAYGSRGGVWVVGASGTPSPRLVVASERVWDVAWSADNATLAYASSGLHLVRVDGTGARQLTAAGIPSFSWSPDGRQLAFANGGVAVADAATGAVRTLVSDPSVDEVAWSRDGRLVAYTASAGVGAVEIATGSTRSLSTDRVVADTPLAWSPGGDLLAYVRATTADSSPFMTTDVRVVGTTGNPRTVVSGGGALGGTFFGVAWTRPPPNIAYRSPEPRSLASASAEELTAPSAITRLATDGGRAAYVSCGHVFVWTPAAGTVEQAEPQASLSPRCNSTSYFSGLDVHTLAIAGDRVAFGLVGGGISRFWWLGGTTVGSGGGPFTLAQGQGITPVSSSTGFVSDLAGAGPLLVFSSVVEGGMGGPKPLRQAVLRAEPAGCPCPALGVEPGPFVPHDVEGGRAAASGDNAVVLLDAVGTRLLTVTTAPLTARSAQLAGGDLVVALEGELRRYDAGNGQLLGSFTVSQGAALQDVARGLVAYVVDGQVRVLRLADGADSLVAAGTAARFIDTGLVLADGNRLRHLRFEALPNQ
jgi:hypothetical protein